MPQNKGQHLTLQDRCVIDDGLRDGLSCREIARRVHVQPSTVSREVASNRTNTPEATCWPRSAPKRLATNGRVRLSRSHRLRGDAERPIHFEIPAKCLKYERPYLRGPIRGTFYLLLYGVPYRPYGRTRPKFQTHTPSFEVNRPFAVPVAQRNALKHEMEGVEEFVREDAY